MSTNEPPPEPPGDQGPPPPYPPAEGGYGGYGEPPPPPAPPGPGGGYSVGTAWGYGWNKFVANLGQILLAVIVLVGIVLAVQAVGYFLSQAVACDPGLTFNSDGTVETNDCGGLVSAQNVVSWLFSLVAWVISMIIGASIVRGALDLVEGRDLDAGRLLRPIKLPEVIVASLIVGILTFVGLIFLVIPGLLVMFFTSYTLYFLMDRQELGAIDAIKESFEFTKAHAGDVFLWFLLSLVTWTVGACLCGVGLIVAVPVVLIGTAYTYKTLNNEPVAP
jgi:uncharacterized membrane protein